MGAPRSRGAPLREEWPRADVDGNRLPYAGLARTCGASIAIAARSLALNALKEPDRRVLFHRVNSLHDQRRRPQIGTQYGGRVRLERILETVLYYSSGQEEDLARFYGAVLGLQALGQGGLTFRVGEGLLLLFNAGLSSAQSQPPPHGARGPIHTCFVARADEYEGWKQRVTEETGSILQEIEWDNGVRSFYFHDPAGNVLEIADGDLWPEQRDAE